MVGPPEVHEVPEVARVTGGIRGSLVPAEPVQSGVVAVRIVVAPLQADPKSILAHTIYFHTCTTSRRANSAIDNTGGLPSQHRKKHVLAWIAPWSGRTRRP